MRLRMTTSSPRTDLTDSAHGQASASFEQAKSAALGPQFLQIVAKPKRATAPFNPEAKPEPKLTRVAFRVSRLMEFCSERELQNQTGHSAWEWPLVVGKELIDNTIDAAEEAEVAPEITVTVEPDAIVVQDNAGGIDAEMIGSVLDYTIRVSSREAYVSPTRGAQGNALKTILAMGHVLGKYAATGDAAGVTIIESRGVKHRIEFRVDHINNQPKIVRRTSASPVEVGTKITVKWPLRASKMLLGHAADRFKELVRAYAWFNPHLTLRGTWFGHEFINVSATDPNWEKWRPRNPTSPHWYDEARLQRYLAAHVARDRDLGQRRTVRDFVAEFRGLSGTAVQRKILTEVGCSHQSLASFFGVRRVNRDGVAKLLAAMQKYSKPVVPKLLGTYRAFRRSDRLRERFEEMEQEFDDEEDDDEEDDADEEAATDEEDAGDKGKEAGVQVPKDLKERVRAILAENDDLRWDDAIRLVLDETQLDRVRAEKQKAKKKSGDFTGAGEDDETAGGA